ncbi:MAG: hypothetical protein ACNA7J_14125 [Wenzhouxiangella sp.]
MPRIFIPIRTMLLGLMIFICGLGTWLVSTPALALIDSVNVTVGDGRPSPDGRLHMAVNGIRTTSAGSEVEVVDVRLEDAQLEIVLDSFPGSLPAFSTFGLSLVIDAVPPGEYTGLVMAGSDATESEELWQVGEFDFVVLEPARHRAPMPIRVWPPDPTTLDETWLLAEPVYTCSEMQLDDSALVIDETPVSCVDGQMPITQPFPLGRLPEQVQSHLLDYRIEDQAAGQANILLTVRDQLSSRLAGSWYDPDQSGHGLTIEVLDPGTLLVYWYTFDQFSEPFWLIAMGDHQGSGLVVLDATMVEGGTFPPNFDSELIERTNWGSLEIQFHSCSQATLAWAPAIAGFEAGEMSLTRLSKAADNNCIDAPPDSVRVPDWFRNADFYFRVGD